MHMITLYNFHIPGRHCRGARQQPQRSVFAIKLLATLHTLGVYVTSPVKSMISVPAAAEILNFLFPNDCCCQALTSPRLQAMKSDWIYFVIPYSGVRRFSGLAPNKGSSDFHGINYGPKVTNDSIALSWRFSLY